MISRTSKEACAFSEQNCPANHALVEHVTSLAATTIAENAAATTVALSADDLADLDGLAQRVGVRVERYGEVHMGYLGG